MLSRVHKTSSTSIQFAQHKINMKGISPVGTYSLVVQTLPATNPNPYVSKEIVAVVHDKTWYTVVLNVDHEQVVTSIQFMHPNRFSSFVLATKR